MRRRSAKQVRPEPAAPNPFRSVPTQVPPTGPAEPEEAATLAHGPVLPPGAPGLPTGGVLVVEGELGDGTVAVVGLHGGAGTTSVQRILARAASGPGGLAFEDAPRTLVVPRTGAALFVARTSGVGLERAHAAAREWGSGAIPGLALLGLVLVADRPKPAPELAAGIKRVARMYPRTWHMPWVPSWHLSPVAVLDEAPRSTTKVARDVLSWAAQRGLEPTPKEMHNP